MGVHVLHISDIHAVADAAALVYGRQADANLRRVVDAAQAQRPRFDAVVVTGDVPTTRRRGRTAECTSSSARSATSFAGCRGTTTSASGWQRWTGMP
jgi:hypothetical protein